MAPGAPVCSRFGDELVDMLDTGISISVLASVVRSGKRGVRGEAEDGGRRRCEGCCSVDALAHAHVEELGELAHRLSEWAVGHAPSFSILPRRGSNGNFAVSEDLVSRAIEFESQHSRQHASEGRRPEVLASRA